MVASEWISLSASVAAFATAMVSLFMLIEMSRQRKISLKPVLIVIDQVIYGYRKENMGNVPAIWLDSESEEGFDQMENQNYKIKIYNLGKSSAKNINVSWDFDFERLIESMDKISYRNGFDISMINETFMSIDGENFKIAFPIASDFGNRIDYILPISDSTSSFSISIPYSYIFLSSLYAHLMFESKNLSKFDSSLLNIKLKLEYKDIENNKYEELFKIRININVFHSVKKDQILSSGKLERAFIASLEQYIE